MYKRREMAIEKRERWGRRQREREREGNMERVKYQVYARKFIESLSGSNSFFLP